MSGRPKKGIDYSGWDVDIFENDTKIDELLDAQGWIGFSIYFYLCQRAYASEGYFYRWSYANAATTARRMGGGIGSETVKQTVAVCLQIGLFDKRLFDLGGVLTSKGIQRRFAQAVQGRRSKTANKSFWLLDKNETRGYEIALENTDLLPTNDHLQDANDHLQAANNPNSKVKESKVKEIINPAAQAGTSIDQIIAEKGFSEKLSTAVTDWISYKKEKRQLYKRTGLKNLIAQIEEKCDSLGEEAVISAIRGSISNNYQGIIWDLVKKPATNKNRFNNFHQRDYDFQQMEKELLNTENREP